MTQRGFPFDSGEGQTYELDWSLMARKWLSDGVFKGVLNELQVYGDSSGMLVKIRSGHAWVRGHYYLNDAEVTQPITAAHATLSRIDRIVLRIDYAANTIRIALLTGTAASSPVAPALTQNDTTYEFLLANVAVGSAVVLIAAGNVTDQRTYAAAGGPLGAANSIYQVNAAGTSAIWSSVLAAPHFTSPVVDSGGLTVTAGNITLTAGTLSVAGNLILNSAAGVIQGGTVSTNFNNNASNATNLTILDTGAVTIARGNLTLTVGNLIFSAAASQIIPGATSFAIRNNANSANNLITTDAGIVTARAQVAVTGVTGTIPLNLGMDSLNVHHIRLAGYCGLQSTSGGAQLWISSNSYFDGTNYKYITTFQASQISMASGAILFQVAASGTAGNNITWTNAVNIIATTGDVQFYNKLGIGTAPLANAIMFLSTTLPNTGGYAHGIYVNATGSTGSTGQINAVTVQAGTQASAFTASAVVAYEVRDASKGAGSTISNLYGLFVNSLTQGANNYGVYINAPSGGSTNIGLYNAGTTTLVGAITASSDLTMTGVLSIGTNLPTAGRIRIANNEAIYTRNSLNTANCVLIYMNGGNQTVVGEQTTAGSDLVLCAGGGGGGNIKFSITGVYYLTLGTSALFPNTDISMSLGTSGNRWTTVYAQTGTINTSSEKAKREIRPFSPIDAMNMVRQTDIVTFKYRTADTYIADMTRLGFIAEKTDRLLSLDGLSSDAQATASLAIAAIKDLDQRIMLLEGKK
jgi:hypothetical protein